MLRILIIIHHLVKKKIFQKNWREIWVKKEKIDYRSNLRKSIHVILIERKVWVFVRGRVLCYIESAQINSLDQHCFRISVKGSLEGGGGNFNIILGCKNIQNMLKNCYTQVIYLKSFYLNGNMKILCLFLSNLPVFTELLRCVNHQNFKFHNWWQNRLMKIILKKLLWSRKSWSSYIWRPV